MRSMKLCEADVLIFAPYFAALMSPSSAAFWSGVIIPPRSCTLLASFGRAPAYRVDGVYQLCHCQQLAGPQIRQGVHLNRLSAPCSIKYRTTLTLLDVVAATITGTPVKRSYEKRHTASVAFTLRPAFSGNRTTWTALTSFNGMYRPLTVFGLAPAPRIQSTI
jgi:hypothetical protein